MSPSQSFLEARDFLLAHRDDYAAAYAGFRWPQLDRFNWALDYFDPFAQGNDRLALWVVDEHGGDARSTFAAMSERSNRVANFLRECGVRRGDRVLVMLGNVVPLWEITLALMKLGAVISPATTLLTPADLQDRIERGGIRHAITDVADTGKLTHLAGDISRITVGGATAGWISYEDAVSAGMVGGYALRHALAHAAVAQVTTLGRSLSGRAAPRADSRLSRPARDLPGVSAAVSQPGHSGRRPNEAPPQTDEV